LSKNEYRRHPQIGTKKLVQKLVQFYKKLNDLNTNLQ